MIFDVIVTAILIIPMALGLYRGFANMFMRAFGWIAATAAGFFLTGTASDFLKESAVGQQISQNISNKLASSADAAVIAAEGLPDIIRGGIVITAGSSSEIFAGLLSSMIITVLSFIIVVLSVKIILRVIVKPVSRRDRRGLLNASDRVLGLVIGFIEGILLVFLFLAMLIPVANFVGMDAATSLNAALQNSHIAGMLYDNNMLLLITGGLFS